MSKTNRTQRSAPRPQSDPRVVAVFHATTAGFVGLVARRAGQGIEVIATREFSAAEAGAGAWADEHLAARRLMVLPSASVIVRAVQLPRAPEEKLASALDLNATTFVLGRTPAFRVVTAVLPGEHGEDNLRTGLVAEWPIDQPAPPLPPGIVEANRLMFAPEVAALAVLASECSDPLVSVDATHGAVSVAAPTSKGVLVRIVRAAGDDGAVDASEIARAVGEACVHAGVPTTEVAHAVERTRAAARDAVAGGFGCTAESLADIAAIVRAPAAADRALWWRTFGVAACTALAALGSGVALTQLQSNDPGARPDRAGAVLNRLAEPRMAARLLVAALLTIAFGPVAFQGLRLLVLRWKLPDIEKFEQAEQMDRQKRAVYGMLARNSASVTKTLSDLAACTPDGIELEFVNIAQSVKGQAITLRGKAPTAKNAQGVDSILTLEQYMRKSGMFDAITRSSDPPNQAGLQNFSIAAVAVHPIEIARYPDGQRWEEKSLRELKYGPFPPDGDRVLSGLDKVPGGSAAASSDPAAETNGGSGTAHAATAVGGDRTPARGSVAGSGARSNNGGRSRTETAPTVTAGGATPTPAGATTAGATPATATQLPIPPEMTDPATNPAGGAAAPPVAGAGADAAPVADAAATAPGHRPAPTGARPAPKGGGPLGGSNTPDPPPAALSEAEINAMTKAQAQTALATVSRARARADLEDDVKARLKSEFEMLLERCKRD